MSNAPLAREEERVRAETRQRAQRPPLYKVILHNDDYTTMDFVVHVLESVFHHSREEAVQIMLHIHNHGMGVAGLFPYETAEAKVERVHTLARENEFPLRCSLEPE